MGLRSWSELQNGLPVSWYSGSSGLLSVLQVSIKKAEGGKMTEKLICPNCERFSYTTAPCEPTPCPYCGFVFSEADKGVKKMRRRILVIDDDSTISDINMPIMDGIKFYRKLIERMPSMRQRVLFITGNKDRETDMFLKEMGLRHLLKPFTTSGLLDALNEADAFRSNV